jgi:hypothetical protein
MRIAAASLVFFAALVFGAACAPPPSSEGSAGSGGANASGGGGGPAPGRGGSSPPSAGSGGESAGGGGASGGASAGGASGTGGTSANPTSTDDASVGVPGDAATSPADASPPTGDAAGLYEGDIPPYEGPPVGPEVKMDCPGDPTAGFTEYQDTFQVGHPYDLPAASRFSIVDGVYDFWVMHGDKKQIITSTAENPRTEARYAARFKTGIRMWSADVYWDKSVTNGTVVMQVHTTTTGIGPVYMVANGSNVSPIDAKKVPGGLIDRWINLKVLINADTTASQYWVNNCLVASRPSGTRGDGNDYFKMGVYHCDVGTCRARIKNVHLYMK